MEECSSTPFLLHMYLIPDAILSHCTSVAIDYMQYFLEGSAATSTMTAPTSDVSGHHKKKTKQNNCRHYFQTQPCITDVHFAASQLQKPRSL